jgi:hypothetical protein
VRKGKTMPRRYTIVVEEPTRIPPKPFYDEAELQEAITALQTAQKLAPAGVTVKLMAVDVPDNPAGLTVANEVIINDATATATVPLKVPPSI